VRREVGACGHDRSPPRLLARSLVAATLLLCGCTQGNDTDASATGDEADQHADRVAPETLTNRRASPEPVIVMHRLAKTSGAGEVLPTRGILARQHSFAVRSFRQPRALEDPS
jgi:hypothetical protein